MYNWLTYSKPPKPKSLATFAKLYGDIDPYLILLLKDHWARESLKKGSLNKLKDRWPNEDKVIALVEANLINSLRFILNGFIYYKYKFK